MNTWIFQGNPKVFDIDNYVSNHNYIWWSIRQEHFSETIKINDEVFLWRSDGGKQGSGGILAKARVESLPRERTDDENAKDYWHTDDWANPYLVVKLKVLEVRLEEGFISRISLLEHSVLNDLLILRLRQQTNYLLSNQHADELKKLWDGNNLNSLKSHSWEVFSKGDVAIKELDKSAFVHHGTGIPIEIRGFFKADDMRRGDKRKIQLQYKNNIYNAYIQIDKHSSPRSRLFWKSDFAEILKSRFPQAYSYYLHNSSKYIGQTFKFKLTRQNDSSYFVELIRHSIEAELVDEDLKSEEIENMESRTEGKIVNYYGKRYERDPINRIRAIEFHGVSCIVCGFNFEEVYGERGKDFIEVHHVIPLNSLDEEVVIDPEKDLVPVCANCHRMIHRRRDDVLSVEDLRVLIGKTLIDK
jgi:5-methylcytosine-specific restriction enzyme A